MNPKCLATKYEGPDPYLFCAFDRRDSRNVWPVIERLALEGIRLWYEDEETPEAVAEKLRASSACMAFLSRDGQKSHALLNKLIYSAAEARPLLFVEMEDGEKTAGLLRLTAGNVCLRWEELAPGQPGAGYRRLAEAVPACAAAGVQADEEALRNWQQRWSRGQKILPPPPPPPPPPPVLTAVIIRCATGEVYRVSRTTTEIGRVTAAYRPDIAIVDPSNCIGRHHAIIIHKDECWFLLDDNSLNGTYIGTEKRPIRQDEKAVLHNGESFYLDTERFVFCCDCDAETLLRMSCEDVLRTYATEKDRASRRFDREVPQEEGTVRNPGLRQGVKLVSQDDPTDLLTRRIEKRDLTAEELEKTVVIKKPAGRKPENVPLPVTALIRLSTGAVYRMDRRENIIGRKSERRRCTVALRGNPGISREHAVIFFYDGQLWIRDCGSLGGTFLEEEPVTESAAVPLRDCNRIRLTDEEFLFVQESSMAALKKMGRLCELQCVQSGLRKILLGEGLYLDRNHPWEDGLLRSEYVSRDKRQTELFYRDDCMWIKDLGSANGTWLNGNEVGEKAQQLCDGAKLTIAIAPYAVDFSYTELPLHFGGETDE